MLGIGVRTLQEWTRCTCTTPATRQQPTPCRWGATLDDVKRMLGHSSITITSDVYGHLVTGRQRAIADALDEAVG